MSDLPKPVYVMAEPHLSGYRVIIGYEALSDAQAAQAALLTPQAREDAQPVGWLRAADEEMVCAHLGVAEAGDSYETAKKKLASLIQWNIAVAMDLSVGGHPAPDALREASLWWNAEDWEQTFDSLEDAYDAATGGEMRGVVKLGRATEHDPVWALRIDLDTTGDGETDDYEIRLFNSVGEAHAYLAALQAEQGAK